MQVAIPSIDNLERAAVQLVGTLPPKLTEGKIRAALYGVGSLGRWALPRLRNAGVLIADCYDANQALNGTIIDGVPVHSPSDLKRSPPEFVLITAREAVAPVSTMLEAIGINHVAYEAWHVATHFAAFRHVHDSILNEDRSREVLRAVLMAMLTSDKRYCAPVYEKDQYFCLPQFCDTGHEIYVDVGAFAGDSVERFIWAQSGVFSKVYAFEPGGRQFIALQVRTERLIREWALDAAYIDLINAGLGESKTIGWVPSDSGQGTRLTVQDNAAGEQVTVLALDDFLEGREITFLKADVEGMEMAVLKGARSTIRQHKPKVAICVYHYPNDIPDISDYLTNLVPAYSFALRHHSSQLFETVLYGWVE
jgi:FkbM family methyltransferase